MLKAVDTDVLIVGAGPVGLFLANECARRGLSWRLVEAHATQSEHSKALAVMPRTLEIFDMAGVVGPFLEVGNRVTWIAVEEPSRTVARMKFAAESPYPFVAMVPQDVTEKLLVEELRRKGGSVEYETTLVSAEERDDHVEATLNQKGQPVGISARFVVGCDGAHSTIRHLLNLPFAGATYDAFFMLADTDTNETLPADEMQLCPSEFGPLAIFPMSSTRRRIVATVPTAEDTAPSLDLVQKILAQRGPKGIEARGVRWSSYFHVHHRQVAKLHVGRIFVAGDAAHIHSPIGGQGMNTGLHDVWNLAWKLDLVLHGHSREQLLDTYDAERLPVIKSVIDMTHFMTRALATPSRIAQAVRDTVIPLVSHIAPVQQGIVERLSQLGIAYTGSPIVEGAGKRCFDDSMCGGTGICSRFLLLLGEEASGATREAAGNFCASLHDLLELRISRRPGITLVRPDGYIAYADSNNHPESTFESIRSLLDRQMHQK
jgi:2-polyprenyl-6-methoxyphenol hydroxylase-like FAD-dependent oxidoreductase